MTEIVLKLHPRFLRDRAASEAFLVRRIARIVSPAGDAQVAPQDHGYAYRLDDGNDWKASGVADDGTIVVAYRYGGGPKNEKMMGALKVFLECQFGPDS